MNSFIQMTTKENESIYIGLTIARMILSIPSTVVTTSMIISTKEQVH